MKSVKRKNIKTRYGEITLLILEQIATSAEGLVYSFLDQKKLRKIFKYGQLFESEKFFAKLRQIEKIGYIEINKKNKRYSIRLTQKGKIKLIENSRDNKIDGKWRMISFDIPEDLKNKRNCFRSSIKRLGFKQVQRSLWASPFIKADKIEKIITYYKLNEYMAYIIVAKSDIENFLLKLFKKELGNKYFRFKRRSFYKANAII